MATALGVTIGAAIACHPEESFETQIGPTAGVRFINAVADTQALDFRFVDAVENSAHWNIAFRNNPITQACVTGSTQIQFKPAAAGDRHLRIFLNDTLQSAATQVIKDTIVTLEAGRLYTALLWGYARPGSSPAMRLTFFEETPPDPGAQVAVRVLNATASPIDVRHYVPSVTSNQVPAGVTWGDVQPLTISPYAMVAPSQLRFNTQPVGGPTLLADALALPGSPSPAVGFDPIPGTTVAGSAITAIVFPLSVAGSEGSQTAPFRPTTGSTSLSASPAGYSRAAGSFLNDCFFVGGTVTASGYTNAANNGTSVVTSVIASRTTGSIALSATATGYDRSTGDFVADGFIPGMWITASGFGTAANNGRSLITAVTATSLTVSKTPVTVVEAQAVGRSTVSDQLLTVSKTVPPVAEAAATGRTVAGATPQVFTTFAWDRRPPR
jgi:hypothetical protein